MFMQDVEIITANFKKPTLFNEGFYDAVQRFHKKRKEHLYLLGYQIGQEFSFQIRKKEFLEKQLKHRKNVRRGIFGRRTYMQLRYDDYLHLTDGKMTHLSMEYRERMCRQIFGIKEKNET